MQSSFLVFFGGGLGATLRYGVNLLTLRLLGPTFPWGTLAINVIGSFVMGLVAGALALRLFEPFAINARLFAMTGILGGFTTFSAFSLDAFGLWERGEAASALAYVLGSVVLSLAAVSVGLAFARHFA